MNVIKDVTFDGRILEQIQKTVEYLETQVKEHSYLGEMVIFKQTVNNSKVCDTRDGGELCLPSRLQH